METPGNSNFSKENRDSKIVVVLWAIYSASDFHNIKWDVFLNYVLYRNSVIRDAIFIIWKWKRYVNKCDMKSFLEIIKNKTKFSCFLSSKHFSIKGRKEKKEGQTIPKRLQTGSNISNYTNS